MPIYTYKCLKCNKEKDTVVLNRDKEIRPVCCRTEMTKQFAKTGEPRVQGGTPKFYR